MIETIADINKRYVWRPPLASYAAPHAQVIDPVQQAYNRGYNDAVAIIKAGGKI